MHFQKQSDTIAKTRLAARPTSGVLGGASARRCLDSTLHMQKTLTLYFPALSHEPVRENKKVNALGFCLLQPSSIRVVLFE